MPASGARITLCRISRTDGSHIAWPNQRSDVRPVDVNVLAAVDGASTPLVTDLAEGRSVKTPLEEAKFAVAPQGPVWGAGNVVAYLNADPESSLVVTDLDNRKPKRVDTGVDAFAWAP